MSIKVSLHYWENVSTVNHTEKLVLLALADWCGDDGSCYPAIASIAKRCCLSDRGVQKVTERLVETGHLLIAANEGKKTGRGSATNRYYLLSYRQANGLKMGEQDSPIAAQRVNAVPQRVNAVPLKGEPHSPDPLLDPLYDPKDSLSPAGARVAVVGSNIPLLETETAITPAAKQVPASRYLPKGLHLTGGHIAPGAGQNAVQVYYERFRPDADRLTCPQEDDLVSGCPDLAKLREVVIAYSQSGYRSCNVKLILDWYRNGIPQHNKPDRPSRRDLQQYNKQTRSNRPPAPNRTSDNEQTTTPSFDQHDLRPDIAEAIDKLYAGIPTRHDRAGD